MAENAGSDSSELESITSSQRSYLKNCPFAGQETSPTKSTDSNNTEVLGNLISPAVLKTPVLSFSTPTSLDSINEDVFRTPPENASLSSPADSEPGVRVSEVKSQKGSNLKSPYSYAETMLLSSPPSENFRVSVSNSKSPYSTAEKTPVSASPSEKVRVLGMNSKSPSSTPETAPVTASPSEKVRIFETNLKSPCSTTETAPVSAPPSEKVRVLETNLKSPSSTAATKPVSGSPSNKVRVLETDVHFDSVSLSSPPSVAAGDVLGSTMGLKNPIFDYVANNGALKSPERVLNLGSASTTKGIKVSKPDGSDEVIPFKEIIEALLRNSGEDLNERDENVSCVEILKQWGLKFP
ncbi:hypothetical protein CARUB_v10023529mg [Capsella rubella]|uniref:Uncharacterized protein n=1 Tax=Capsella rubella TaxID=81985 RepID=R0FWQ1_9BRAS|nr:transcription initiation factor TFIID subunit 12 [Capsella rubella]EOA27397.1 hypothetical protein CARUB_v10023529mg [Capsella rubella]